MKTALAEANRRRAVRFQAERIGFRSREIDARLVDVSRSGVAIESLDQPPIGARVGFTLEEGPWRLALDGEVLWSSLRKTLRTGGGEVVPVYRAGLKLQRADSRRLHELLRSLGSRSRRRARGGDQ